MYAGNIIGNYIMILVSLSTGKVIANPVAEMLSGPSFWINTIVVAVIGPIIEEIIFRKLILDRTHIWGEKTAMVFSALIFALLHGNLYQFFYAFGMGLIFAYIYIRTGRIRYTIALHMFINGFFGVFANWVISKVPLELLETLADSEYIESIYASEEAMTEFINQLMPHMPGLALYCFYAFAIFFMTLGGFVLYLIYRKKLTLKKSAFELPRGYVCGPVYGAPGVMITITLGVILVALNLIA
jgi:membrane protease YdiL (CAAX protease family)